MKSQWNEKCITCFEFLNPIAIMMACLYALRMYVHTYIFAPPLEQSIGKNLVYDWNHHFGLGPIHKLKAKNPVSKDKI